MNETMAPPNDLSRKSVAEISDALRQLLADVFALYVKTKNFHWHMSGPHFRDYHLLLDEQAAQIFGTTDTIAERVRKLGGTTIRSIGHISRLQRITDNDIDKVAPADMLAELLHDNRLIVGEMRHVHALCDEQDSEILRTRGIDGLIAMPNTKADALSARAS